MGAALVPAPEASVREGGLALLGEDKVARAGQAASMQPEAVEHIVRGTTDRELELGAASWAGAARVVHGPMI
jgi:hypothetical protein